MPEYEKKTDKEHVSEITDKLENGIKDFVNGNNFKKYFLRFLNSTITALTTQCLSL